MRSSVQREREGIAMHVSKRSNCRTAKALSFLPAAVLLFGCIAATAGSAPPPTQRVFTMVAVEPKGGTTVDKEPFPGEPLPEGQGYVLKAPDPKTGRWEVSTYRWEPSQIVVYQGDIVVLEILGVNGDVHPSTIEHYVPAFEVRRGRVTRLRFTADTPGFFKIECLP